MIPKITFMESLIWFWMKGTIAFEENMVKLSDPHFFLKIIPTGTKKKNIPVTQISSVGTSFKFKFGALILGLFMFLVALSFIAAEDISPIAVIIVLLIAISQTASAFETLLTITLTSGEEVTTEFIIFERTKAEQAADTLNQLIVSRMNSTITR